ncbi:hypothetical protein FBU30_002902 [Linnemannia zychae]|nr:hypothetical protein FBU30_002902 [Linnemannia zychae]
MAKKLLTDISAAAVVVVVGDGVATRVVVHVEMAKENAGSSAVFATAEDHGHNDLVDAGVAAVLVALLKNSKVGTADMTAAVVLDCVEVAYAAA